MIDTSQNMLYHISNLNTENQRISYQMATGKNMDKGSEDSILHSSLINLEDKLRVTEGLKLQITKSKAINDTADTNLAEMKTSLDAIKVDLLKGLNAGMDRNSKLALATNLSGIRDNMFDRVNAVVDGEYIFTGSETSKQTLLKDENFDLNGKIEFGGDGFLREIAVQPGSYRDRGVTAYDVAFHNYDNYDAISTKSDPENWDGKAYAGEQIVFESNDRIIDEEGFEWKANTAGDKIQKYDHNGDIYHPAVEIDLFRTNEPKAMVDLGIDGNTDATGDYTVTIAGAPGSPYTYTAAATDASTVFADLKLQIEADGYTVSGSLDKNDQFYVSSSDGSDIELNVTGTDTQYTISASNSIEATTNSPARQATWSFTAPTSPEGRVFEAKHNYFDDLNITINALEGHSTMLDGSKGPIINDAVVNTVVTNGLELTSKQFDASNVGHGELGGRNNVFDIAYDKLLTQETHYNILIQETGGADLAKLSMESKALELTYQSLYTTISKMNKLSLLNYIN